MNSQEDCRKVVCYNCCSEIASFDDLPWGEELFDVYIIMFQKSFDEASAERLSSYLVKLNNDWIETMGCNAELFHDVIDQESVKSGRQERVGDGKPMTVWGEEFTDLESINMDSIVEYIANGGVGLNFNKLIVIIGSEVQTKSIADKLSAL